MNGDQTPMEPLLHSAQLKVLFILFMVISNWMVLAILTAVVSENMLSATNEFMRAERQEDADKLKKKSSQRLLALFKEIDKDNDGTIDEPEFHAVLADKYLRNEFCEATGLDTRDLKDLFSFLSREQGDGHWSIGYEEFVMKIQAEGKDVSERSVFRIEREMRLLEMRIDSKLECLREEVRVPNPNRSSDCPDGHGLSGSKHQIRNRRSNSRQNHLDDCATGSGTLQATLQTSSSQKRIGRDP